MPAGLGREGGVLVRLELMESDKRGEMDDIAINPFPPE
jgi:hypothetical protein